MGLCVCMYAIVYTCVAKCYMWGSCGFVEDNMFDSHPEDITWSYVDSYIRAIYTWVDKIVSTEQKKHNFFSFKLRERDYFPAIGILYLLWDSDMDSPVSTISVRWWWCLLFNEAACNIHTSLRSAVSRCPSRHGHSRDVWWCDVTQDYAKRTEVTKRC